MATRLLLNELVQMYKQQTGLAVSIESVGGVDAARRVQSGESFDVVLLASDAIATLQASGHVAIGTALDWVRSGVAAAVRDGAPVPDFSDEAAVREAVLQAPSVSYSTGPSGVALAQLFDRWGITEAVRNRLVTPPPGVPVGSLVAKGEVALGFQQLSELLHVPGLHIVGALPPAIQIITTFSGAVASAASDAPAAQAFLAYLGSPQTAAAKRRQGMEPVLSAL